MTNLTFHVTFEHKDKGHGTSMTYGSLKEVKESIRYMKEYNCIGIEIILDITELIRE